MGMISLLGNAGAFVGPYLVGYIRESSGSFKGGVFFLVASLWLAAFLAYWLDKHIRPKREQEMFVGDDSVFDEESSIRYGARFWTTGKEP